MLYDENVVYLSDSNQKYLAEVRDCPDLVVSSKGRLEPQKK